MHSDTYATEQNGNPYQKKKVITKSKIRFYYYRTDLCSSPSLSSCTCAHQSSLGSFDAESQN